MSDSIYDVHVTTLDGEDKDLSDVRDHVLLVVNTASKCGFTPQYEALQKLHEEYAGRGLRVLGFPCNQFGHQEPGDAKQIAEFCDRSFGVSFPMHAKVDVNGSGTHPLFRMLKSAAPGLFGSESIKWNFTKFLVGRDGEVKRRHAPKTDPATLRDEIEALLGDGRGA